MEENNLSNAIRKPIRFLIFSASLREDSLNTKLAALAAGFIEKHNGTVDFANMKEFDCPSFDEDLEKEIGTVSGAEEFRNRLLANDAFIISSPEYNLSMPGLLKNAIDWVSRFYPQPFYERQALLMSASPSIAGGNGSLWSLRIPLEHLGARVFPEMFSLAMAHHAFTKDGRIANPALAESFEKTIVAFMNLTEAQKHYPYGRNTWEELGRENLKEYLELSKC
jgi:NAD(P)H-dependent FMN reductase